MVKFTGLDYRVACFVRAFCFYTSLTKMQARGTFLSAGSGKSGGLLLPSPLRTVRATFIAYRSSTLNAYGQRNSCNTVFTIHTCNDFTTSVARSQSMSCHIIELLRWIASDALRPVIVLLIGIQLDISSAFLSFC